MKQDCHEFFELNPDPDCLIESMRSIGYSVEAAVADIMDNSISANASEIHLMGVYFEGRSSLMIRDNGNGMDLDELKSAMRLGSRSPREERSKGDLGRFGLGLKTASFSQCRKLTVFSRKNGGQHAICWNLDHVKQYRKWEVEILTQPQIKEVSETEKISRNGTIVLWEDLDRALGLTTNLSRTRFNSMIKSIKDHLELVFHRYLHGEGGIKKVEIFVNNHPIAPLDPFNSKSPSTHAFQTDCFPSTEGIIESRAFILPHQSKVSRKEWERHSLSHIHPGGYNRNQGFYIYRKKRLLIWGTWFRLKAMNHLSQLARIRIDIPNTVAEDERWSIDVKKSTASPPPEVRDRLKNVIHQIEENSKRPYTSRGRKVLEESYESMWNRYEKNNDIHYIINRSHSLIAGLENQMDDVEISRLKALLSLLETSLPVSTVFADLGDSTKNVNQPGIDQAQVKETLDAYAKLLFEEQGKSVDEVKSILNSMPPFDSYPNLVSGALKILSKDVTSAQS